MTEKCFSFLARPLSGHSSYWTNTARSPASFARLCFSFRSAMIFDLWNRASGMLSSETTRNSLTTTNSTQSSALRLSWQLLGGVGQLMSITKKKPFTLSLQKQQKKLDLTNKSLIVLLSGAFRNVDGLLPGSAAPPAGSSSNIANAAWRFLHVCRPRRSLLEWILHVQTVLQTTGPNAGVHAQVSA